MWFSRRHTAVSNDFSSQLQRVENRVLQRLDFIETQLDRVNRRDRKWDAHITVVDADIQQVGMPTMTLYFLRNPSLWPLWVYALIGSVIVVSAVIAAVRLW